MWPKFADTNWAPAGMISSGIMVLLWGYFIWTGSIATIWPLFGVANQLLASVALAVGTTMLINNGRSRVAWVTIVPLAFLSVTTLTAGYLSIRDNFWPLTASPTPSVYIQGYVDSIAMAIMLVCAVIIFAAALRRWSLVLTGKVAMADLAQA
jgi:carbon starvation protein